MKINTAEFIISNSDVSKCPNEPLPEYAFIGRSNVGKSSLINMLTGRNRVQLKARLENRALEDKAILQPGMQLFLQRSRQHEPSLCIHLTFICPYNGVQAVTIIQFTKQI